MAPSVGIDLNTVVEKPRLPAAQQFTFSFRKAEQTMGKKPNKQTGKIEPYIACEAYPIDPGWEDRCVYQNFSMAPGALSSPDASFSVKKFFQVVGFAWNASGGFNTEDLLTIKFVATVKYKEEGGLPQFDKILRAA